MLVLATRGCEQYTSNMDLLFKIGCQRKDSHISKNTCIVAKQFPIFSLKFMLSVSH